MTTIKTSVICALVCLLLVSGGCGLFNSEEKQQTAELERDLVDAKNDFRTHHKAFYEATDDLEAKERGLKAAHAALATAKNEQKLLQKQLDAAKADLSAARIKVAAAATDQKKARAAALAANKRIRELIKAGEGMKTVNASLKKSADALKAENDRLRNAKISLGLKIRALEKELAALKKSAK